MKLKPFLELLVEYASRYQTGDISGSEYVLLFDQLMADFIPDELPQNLYDTLDDYQEELALYVEDEANRLEDEHYYGPEGLAKKIKGNLEFLQRYSEHDANAS